MARANTIRGLARLEQKLKALPAAATAEIRAAMEAQANEVVAMMRRLVRKKTKALHDSIGWTWGKAPKGAMTVGEIAGRSLGAGLTITIYAGTRDKSLGDMDAYYVRWVEFGTQHSAAHPFFFVSWRSSRKTVKRKVRAGIRRAARKVAGGQS